MTDISKNAELQQSCITAVNHSVLTLEHLAPYFPYGLKIYKSAVSQLNEFNLPYVLNHCKPILRPFSDYTEILEITDEMNDYEIQMIEDNPDLIKRLPYDVIEKMFKNHIDVFGLINFGLAVSIHDAV